MIAPDNKPIYKLARLIAIFTAALEAKEQKVAALKIAEPGGIGEWAAAWPDGNANEERRIVSLLKDWKSEGVNRVQTEFPLADPDLLEDSDSSDRLPGSPQRTLAAQIKNDQVVKLVV